MKKIYSLLSAMMIFAVSLFALASCEMYVNDYDYDPYGGGDRGRASVITGQWQGDFGMYYSVQHPYTGQLVTFDANYSYVQFYSDYYGARSGWGKQIDFYRTGPYQYQYYQFYWEVRNGVLYLTYPQDHNLDVAIYDYYLDNQYFTGRMGTSNFQFRLSKLSYNYWNSYSGNYMYGVYDSWSWGTPYYSPKRQMEGVETAPAANNAAANDNTPEALNIVRGRKS